MERTSSPHDFNQALVYILLSVLLLGSVATQDGLSHANRTLDTQDDLSTDNSTLDTLDVLSYYNGSLETVDAFVTGNTTTDTLDVLPHDNGSIGIQDVLSYDSSTIGTLDVLPSDNSTLAIMDAMPQDNSTLATLDAVPIESSTLATQDVFLPVTSTLTDTKTIDPASCDHKGLCHTGLVCGCYYYKRIDRLGRVMSDCRKMIDCSQKNLTVDTLRNFPFSQFGDQILDVNMTGVKLKVEDIDSLGEYIYKNTETKETILYFGPLQQLPCPTKIHILRKWGLTDSITEVLCNNQSLTDQHIEDMVLPASTSRLWLEHNQLTVKDRLEAIMQPLRRLNEVNLSFNKLTAIPRINFTQMIKPPEYYFLLYVNNNDIRTYDSATLEQYAPTDDSIFISIENNPFVCNCEAYYTNNVFVKHGETNNGKFKCLMLDEITGENTLISLPGNEDKYWKDKCDSWEPDWNVDRKATNLVRRDSNK